MSSSETYGIQKGYGVRVVAWINEYAAKKGLKLETRLYGHTIHTQNFGDFEMFSWMGDVKAARRATVQAAKRFRIRIIEGGYKTRESMFSTSKVDYGMVRDGARMVGKIKFESPRIGSRMWRVSGEEPC